MPAVMCLIIGGLVKIWIFNFSLNKNFSYHLNFYCKTIKLSVGNIIVAFSIANLIIYFACFRLVKNENDCQLYLSNFVTFDLICSFLALFNMWREYHQLELKYDFIAK